LANAKEERERAVREYDEALKARVPLPDDVDAVPTIDEVVLAPEEPDDAVKERPIVRNSCSPEEFRWAFGADILPPSTLRRWMSGDLPHPRGDRRNIFDPPKRGQKYPSAVEKPAGRYRIRIDKLDLSRFHPHVIARLEEIMRTPEKSRAVARLL
jgi:hypothetical protein